MCNYRQSMRDFHLIDYKILVEFLNVIPNYYFALHIAVQCVLWNRFKWGQTASVTFYYYIYYMVSRYEQILYVAFKWVLIFTHMKYSWRYA